MPPPVEAAAGYAMEKGQRKTNASEGAQMKQHITQATALSIFSEITKEGKGFATTQELMNVAIQHYIDSRKAELPVLPEPDRLTSNCAVPWHSDELIKAYGQKCAAHARGVALEEAETKYSSLVMAADEAMRNGILDIGIEEAIEQLKAGK